jgi:hypothetical protein
MIGMPREARRRKVCAMAIGCEEVFLPRVAAGLAGALVVVAGLLLAVVAQEIHDEPKVHDLAQGGSFDQRVWNAFSSESQRVTAMRGGLFKTALPASRGGRPK